MPPDSHERSDNDDRTTDPHAPAADLADSFPWGCQIIDREWRYVYVNDPVCQQAGMERDQLLGRTMMECFPGIDQTPMFSILRTCMSDRLHDRMENEFTFPDGSRGWFELQFIPVQRGVAILSRDVSDARARLTTLIAGSEDAVIDCAADGRITAWNKSAVRIFGYPESEILSRTMSDLFPLDAAEDEDSRRGAGIAADQKISHFEAIGRRRDGRSIRLAGSVSPHRDSTGELNGVTVIVRDVSDRLERQRLAALFDLARSANQRLDPDSILRVALGNIVDLLHCEMAVAMRLENGWGARFSVMGVDGPAADLAEQCGLGVNAAIPPGDTSLEAQIGQPRPVWCHEPQSDLRPLEQRMVAAGIHSWCAAPLVTESRLLGVLLVADRRRARFSEGAAEGLAQFGESLAVALRNASLFEELDAAYEQLQKAHRVAIEQERFHAMGQMASGIAHDLNNALSPVVTLSEMLIEGLVPHEKVPRYLQGIRDAALDSQTTIARLRDFFRPPDDADFTAVDPNRLVESAIEISKPRWQSASTASGSGIRAEVDLAPDVPRIHGIESELRQALLNLIINAADAMPQGGTLTLSTAITHRAGESDAAEVEIRVADTGVGMDEDTSSSAFDLYFTTKRESGGTGLGLSSVRATVDRHGGGVSIESTPGLGTTVTIALPACPDEDARTTSFGTATRGRIDPLTVLCVDDDPRLRTLLQEMLDVLGHHPVIADGGATACELFDPSTHHLVITDLGMPRVNGREVAEHVKRRSPATPVVLLTGWGHQLIDTGRTPPAIDLVLSKPPSLDQMRAAITRLARARRHPPQ